MNTTNKNNKGCFIVLMGPDGAGKSTVAAAIDDYASEHSLLFQKFHWRPGLLPKPGKNNPTQNSDTSNDVSPPLPPAEFAYGTLTSLIRYTYYLMDFIFGYWIKLYPAKRSGALIIGERWYFDVIINPARYGFRLPNWLLVVGGYLVPSPDMVILLSGSPEAIHERKPELTAEEISTQLIAMKSLVGDMKNSFTISTDGSVNDTIQNVHTSISTVMSK